MTIHGVAGHMHLLGRSIKIEVNPGTPQAQTVLDIPVWDFDNQGSQADQADARCEPGDTVKVTCTPRPVAARQAAVVRGPARPVRRVGRGHHRRDVPRASCRSPAPERPTVDRLPLVTRGTRAVRARSMEGLTHRPGRPPARASMTATTPARLLDQRADRTRTPSSSPTASTWSACSAPATSTSASSSGPSTPTSTSAATGSPSRGEPAEVALAERLLDELVTIIRTGQGVTAETVERVIAMLRAETTERPADVLSLNILTNRGRTIRPKTLNQKRYVDSIDKHTITFGIGPAGTGKTYLAMAKAVQALQAKKVNRIILTRPAVEAGERLGFLPGTLSEKIDPYLRPLYDALHDMLDPETIPKLLAAGTIEVAPLAYMRGRSLNDSFIILDEAQNTSPEQMKMFLTRLGFGSKIVVTGDVTQVDLPGGHEVRPAGRRGHPRRRRGHHLQPAHRPRRGPPPAGRQDRRGVRRASTPRSERAGPEHDRREGPPDEHRGPQRVRARPRRTPALARWPLRDGPDARPPAGRAVHQGRRRGHHRRAQRAVDGEGGPDRRARLPDGRAAPRPGQRGARGGRARRPGALPRRSPSGRATTAGHGPRPRSSC